MGEKDFNAMELKLVKIKVEDLCPHSRVTADESHCTD